MVAPFIYKLSKPFSTKQYITMLKFSNERFAVIDELQFFQSIYLPKFRPKNVFYKIKNPFKFDSQMNKLAKTEGKSKKRRFQESDTFLAHNCVLAENTFEEFKKWKNNDFFGGPSSSNNNNNNLEARLAVKDAPKFSEVKLKDSSSLETKNIFEENNEICLTEPILYKNKAQNVLKVFQRNYILPTNCQFLCGDVKMIRHFVYSEMCFDLIVMDPPWPNKSVKRKKSYVYFELEELDDLPIGELCINGGLVCIWLTNNQNIHEHVGEVLANKWNLKKVCDTGEPVCEFRPEHKVPFESLVFACHPEDFEKFTMKIPNNFCIFSTPNANPSRKPPIKEILKELKFYESTVCLELYSRYLLPDTTSVGFEALKFQDEYYFE